MAEATQFFVQRVDTRVGPVALVTIDNGADHTKPSTFGRHALESLERALRRLEGEEWAGMLLTGKPFVFAAGADIDELPAMSTPELARAAARAGHELFARLRALPYATLAAINGAALGGGVEIALHCDFRTISAGVRHFACPEVFLGIVPAWGGTQLVPRLVGARAAVDVVVANPLRQNRMLTGRQAFELGFADALLEPVEFVDDSLAFLVEAIETGRAPREPADLSDAADVCRRARAQVDDQVHGAAPAPYRALELIEGAASWTLEQGYRAEEDALAELLPGPEAQASVYAFDVVERRVKRGVGRPDAAPRPVARVGIVGAGLMARQLALLVLRRLELPVVLRDLGDEQVEEALAWIRGELAGLVAKGRLPERKARFLGSSVSGGTSYEAFAGCDLVLEAVFEELAVKREALAAVEAVVGPDCVLATNTSSLSVRALGEPLARPQRLVGMHFFNPVALLPLVELVRAPATDDATLATAWEVTERLGKRGVLVRDAPGFVVNRLLTRMTTVLMDALEHGNTVEQTDEAALRIGLPMAPSLLLAMVGPRVANHVLETLHRASPERFPLSQTLANFAAGRDEVALVAREPRSVDEIHEAVLEALADEVRHVLEEGVVSSAAEVDACLILGAGWPFFRGGITRYLDASGISERVVGRRLADVGGTVLR
ncbi:MAG TPA: 3-hydroxyacyl-CoA dehydrogenase NAD-binding domain-containing protein [Gaiellaceae bacterium]|nr:3-hydroxyacyl-CoA dehydrogenase NAD-binding domain-containing protein [Gaiellaceae bacterium]